jgi:hypothetical protein
MGPPQKGSGNHIMNARNTIIPILAIEEGIIIGPAYRGLSGG